jgi:hypothetical protein
MTISNRSSRESSAICVIFKQELERMNSAEFHKFYLLGGETISAEERTDEANIRLS